MSEKDNAKVRNPDLATAIYRLAVVILLAGILVVQWQILGNTNGAPSGGAGIGPTWGEIRKARTPQEQQALTDQVPVFRVSGGPIAVLGRVGIDSVSIAQIRGEQ